MYLHMFMCMCMYTLHVSLTPATATWVLIIYACVWQVHIVWQVWEVREANRHTCTCTCKDWGGACTWFALMELGMKVYACMHVCTWMISLRDKATQGHYTWQHFLRKNELPQVGPCTCTCVYLYNVCTCYGAVRTCKRMCVHAFVNVHSSFGWAHVHALFK